MCPCPRMHPAAAAPSALAPPAPLPIALARAVRPVREGTPRQARREYHRIRARRRARTRSEAAQAELSRCMAASCLTTAPLSEQYGGVAVIAGVLSRSDAATRRAFTHADYGCIRCTLHLSTTSTPSSTAPRASNPSSSSGWTSAA